jgi:hypothetical protein
MDTLTNDICVVIQGASTNVAEQKEAWKEFSDQIVFSTWKGEESKYLDVDSVIYSDPVLDGGVANLNRQAITTLRGIEYAKKMGYGRVLKMRADQVPTNATEFLRGFSKYNLTVFLYHLHEEGYYVDYFMCGTTDVMHSIWSLDGLQKCKYPEWAITNQIRSVYDGKVEFYKNRMSKDNSVFFYKWGVDLYDLWNNHESWRFEG